MKVGAVILAAGAGMRLGGVAKALLEGKAKRTFLTSILATAREVGTEDVIVVVGPPYGDAVGAHALELGLRAVVNAEPEHGMASSVAVGFAAISETDCDAAWLWPVDHPDVAPETLAKLVGAIAMHASARPVVDGRGGHPPLISRSLWPALAACADLDGGARTVLAGADVVDVEVDDPGCVRDVDTALDLESV